MKRLTLVIIAALFIVGAGSMVFAQGHRHSQRNDSVEKVIVENSKSGDIEVVSDAYEDGFVDGEALRNFVDETVNEAFENAGIPYHDRRGFMADAVDGGIVIAVLAIIGLFFGPAIILAIILYFIYKRKKQRDAVVIAAINKGVEVPAGYGSAPKVTAATTTESNKTYTKKTTVAAEDPMQHKGIKNIAIGVGLAILARYLHLDLLTGIGWFVAVYGIGQIVIAYVSGEKTQNKRTYKNEIEEINFDDEKPE